jgi:hypothetical protein
VHESYLLGGQKCLRHGRDMLALDYEPEASCRGGVLELSCAGIDMRNGRENVSKLNGQFERG